MTDEKKHNNRLGLHRTNAELGLTKVYEVIDASTDEYYQILGLFLSFDEAKAKNNSARCFARFYFFSCRRC